MNAGIRVVADDGRWQFFRDASIAEVEPRLRCKAQQKLKFTPLTSFPIYDPEEKLSSLRYNNVTRNFLASRFFLCLRGSSFYRGHRLRRSHIGVVCFVCF